MRNRVWMGLGCALAACAALAAEPPATPRDPPAPRPDPFKATYSKYRPDFLDHIYGRVGALRSYRMPEKKMQLSSEPTFYTLNLIEEDTRANALVAAALDKEEQGKYRDALKIYQIVIEKYPECMYRVSKFGVFVPMAAYCQRRILGFPAEHLAYYRTLYDARAAEAFGQARRKHSLIGLSDVVNSMLATSYGGRAVLELGNASLDSGHYLAALERFGTVRGFFPYPELRTPELDLKVAYCCKMLGTEPGTSRGPGIASKLSPQQLTRLDQVLKSAQVDRAPFHSQLTSGPHVSADDYTLMPPTDDPLALREPTWRRTLPGSRREYFVFSHPVVTPDSIIYRHKNLVYCHSLLNGELRWTFDIAGRATWQNWTECRYPQEDVLVQDGRVFATVSKGGASLVALDQVTGKLSWAYGPMVASTPEEARMRFLTAPAGGPRTVYAAYVLDNIEGETHIDTEYGIIAFESATGRIRWRRELCRLSPGKFAAGFAVRRRNRIRSFASPPLYHQGTVYHVTNAGAIAALDALSGRVKWLCRYPYYPGIHDATRGFGKRRPLLPGARSLRLWFNQRPLVVGERLYVLPVDSAVMLCIDRRTGRVLWSKPQAGPDVRYFLGPMSTGELVMVYSGRGKRIAWYGGMSCRPIHILDPKTGRTLWESPDLIAHEPHPVLKHYIYGTCAFVDFNQRWTEMAARPFLTQDDKLHITTVGNTIVYHTTPGRFYTLTSVDLREKKITGYRRYLSGPVVATAEQAIRASAPNDLRAHLALPHKDAQVKHRIKVMTEISKDTVPENKHGPFMPFSRITFKRYGVPFELRFGPRELSVVYARAAVLTALSARRDTAADFAKAELAIAESQYARAATQLKRCLDTISSEDLDFRALINQQLYRVHKRLCRSAIRAGQVDRELQNCLGMSRTASTLADEVETLFALSEAYERKGQPMAAARCLRSVIGTYGHHEYPVASAAALDPDGMLAAADQVLDKASAYGKNPFYGGEFDQAFRLMRKGLPLYRSTVSPLPKDLTVRAGELAARRLIRLQKQSKEFADPFERLAASELRGRSADEQLHRLWEFPGTATAQAVLTALYEKQKGARDKAQLWRLTDAARVSGLTVPAAWRATVLAPPPLRRSVSVALPRKERAVNLADAEGINWLVLERHGQRDRLPELLFLGGRVRKRLDNKFVLSAFDLKRGKQAWRKDNIRLKGTGQEPGFFRACVFAPAGAKQGELVIVHGLYDVLAFEARTGTLRWRFRGPFDFEIKHSVMSGDLLVLAGETETLALDLATSSPAGQVAWQVKEMGDLYTSPYFAGDRLVSVRKMPFSLTVRFRATGKMIGRLEIPDLTLFDAHPLLEKGPRDLPLARDGKLLVVTDGWYYIVLDVERLAVVWKRLIDENDLTRETPLRFALKGDYLAVVKQDYDQKVIWMLSSRTGEVLWHTDPKDGRSPQPMHSMFMTDDGKLFGLGVHPGQSFYFVGRDCKTGRLLFQELAGGYGSKPVVSTMRRAFGVHAAVTLQDRQDFELKVFDIRTGKHLHTVKKKGVGPFGVHGRVSATVQNGRLVLLCKDKLSL